MKRLEVEILGEAINAHVLQLPNRRFPSLILQGDSLHAMVLAAQRARELFAAGNLEDGAGELQELLGQLQAFQAEYEAALLAAGRELPY